MTEIEMRRVGAEQLAPFMTALLASHGVRSEIGAPVVEGLLHASLRGVDSHGVRLLPHYLRAVKSGRINIEPDFKFEQRLPAAGRLNADHTFGHTAGVEGMRKAIELAREVGVGAVSVCDSTHYGAAAYFALMAPEEDMIGYSFTNTDALVVPTGSKERFIGNSPLCFAAPCAGEEPFCLDMATSVVTWNKVLQLRETNTPLQPQWCVDAEGIETTDPHRATGLWPLGGYKGYGLSVMVETLCSILGGMPFGPHIVPMFAGPIEAKRHLGHFFMAMRIDAFQEAEVFKNSLKQLVDELRAMPPTELDEPVMVAGDPEKKMAAERSEHGIPLPVTLLDEYKNLATQCDVAYDL